MTFLAYVARLGLAGARLGGFPLVGVGWRAEWREIRFGHRLEGFKVKPPPPTIYKDRI